MARRLAVICACAALAAHCAEAEERAPDLDLARVFERSQRAQADAKAAIARARRHLSAAEVKVVDEGVLHTFDDASCLGAGSAPLMVSKKTSGELAFSRNGAELVRADAPVVVEHEQHDQECPSPARPGSPPWPPRREGWCFPAALHEEPRSQAACSQSPPEALLKSPV